MKNKNLEFMRFFGRVRVLVMTVFFIVLLGGCGKNYNVTWLYYDETQCADRWDRSSNNEVQKTFVEDYFKGKGVKVYDVEIFSDGTADACADCSCRTGRRIKLKVKNKQVDEVKAEGFYK